MASNFVSNVWLRCKTVIADLMKARQRDTRMVLRAAMREAHSQRDDDDAADMLRTVVSGRRRGAEAGLAFLAPRRHEFDRDRAYRLLEAVISGAVVKSIDLDRRELFAREERLGRMPLAMAFEELCGLQPGLRELKHDAESARATHATVRPGAFDFALETRLTILVGPSAQHADELVRSTLAASLVPQYLMMIAGDHQYGEPRTPYFEAPRRFVKLKS